MAIDPTLIGRAFPTRPYEVGTESVRAFATAVKEASDTDIAPATLAIIPAFRGLDAFVEAAGIDYRNVVHADQRFVYDRPIRVGDVLVTTATADGVKRLGPNELVTLRCELASDSGEHVCTATSTILVRTQG